MLPVVLKFKFQQLAFGNVLDRSVHPNGLALIVMVQLSQSVHPAGGLVGLTGDAVFLVEFMAASQYVILEIGCHHGSVVWVNQGYPFVVGAYKSFFQAKYLVEDGRVCPESGFNIEQVTAHLGNMLRFQECRFAFL